MKLKFIFPVFMLFFGIISCDIQKETKTLKLAHGLDTQHPVHKAMEILGERLEEKSGGKLKLQIYPR